MATGRKPTPTNLKLLKGNPGKRPLNAAEPMPAPKIPNPPDHVKGEARKEWFRISKQLHELGLLTEIDRAALAAYCVAWGRWVEAEEQLAKYGTVIKSPDKGWLVQSPYLSIANRAMDQMAKMLAEFGMSPSSRSRVQSVKELTSRDEMEGLLGGRRQA